jgi:hypothetical protein
VAVNSAAPFNGFELFAARQFGNLPCLFMGTVVAPEEILVERLELIVDRDHTRSGSVEGKCDNLLRVDRGMAKHVMHGLDQSLHLVFMRLRSEIGIFHTAMQRITCGSSPQSSSLTIEQGDANTQRSEIYPGDDRHIYLLSLWRKRY